jgi:hypothetical protein
MRVIEANPLQWDASLLIDPLFGCAGCPDEIQFFG